MLLAGEIDLQLVGRAAGLAQLLVRQDMVDPRDERGRIVRLADEIVGAAFQARRDVLNAGERRCSDERKTPRDQPVASSTLRLILLLENSRRAALAPNCRPA